MKKRLGKILRGFFDTVERKKGKRHFTQKRTNGGTHYRVHTSRGDTFYLHCDEWVTKSEYKAWWARTKHAKTYVVYIEFGEDFPKEVGKKLQLSITFPLLTNLLCSTDFKKKTAIKAYLDAVINKMS